MGDATAGRPRAVAAPAPHEPGAALAPRAAHAVLGVARNAVLGVVAAALLALAVLGAALVPLAGLGVPVLVEVAALVRSCAGAQRRWAGDELGVALSDPYRRWPDGPLLARVAALGRDRATRRDVGWLAWQSAAGALGALAVGTPVLVAWFLLVVVPNEGWLYVVLAAPAAVALGLAALVAIPLVRVHAVVSRRLLAGRDERSPATARIAELTRSRAETVDAGAAELRRIERDLHDGVQARLVSMGMAVGMARAEVRRSPDRAEELLDDVRASVATTLDELRALVRGIHPPVLAERGLPDALEALAGRAAVPVHTRIDRAARADPAVETALYFAAAELLTNVGRHAGAESAGLELRRDASGLVLLLTDDGRGGADPAGGSGLRGVRERLAAFDGTISVASPPGGPTEIRLEVPCAR